MVLSAPARTYIFSLISFKKAEQQDGDPVGDRAHPVVYLCILALAAIQFVIAYQNIDGSQMFVRMLMLLSSKPGWRYCSSCIWRKIADCCGLS
jgi:hypothetical protein